MQIKDLQAKQGKVELIADVVEKGEIRQFEKFGNPGRVCNATLSDETGTVKFTLWNDQIDQVNEGDKIKVTNGYVNEWQGEKQLTTGKFGQMEIIGKGDAPAPAADSAKETPAEPATPASEPSPEAAQEEDELFDVEEERVD